MQIMRKSTRVPKVKDPFKLVRGILSDLRGKMTSVELQHETSKIWAKMICNKKQNRNA